MKEIPVIALDPEETAQAIGISKRTVEELIKDRKLAVCRVGRSVRIKVKDIEAYLDSVREPTDAELEARVAAMPRSNMPSARQQSRIPAVSR